MASIVIELRDFTTVERSNMLVSIIDDKIGHEEEVKEIRIEGINMKKPEEMHKDVQELMEDGIDVEELKSKYSYLTDRNNKRWKYKNSYNNPVGVEVIILENF